jgi:hypothetical protein
MATDTEVRSSYFMPKGAWTAWTSVLMVAVLGIGAAAWSVATSPGPLIVQSGPPAAAALHQAVKATVDSQSFVEQGYAEEGNFCAPGSDHLLFRMVYQAPDRNEEVITGQLTEIAIGTTLYVKDDGSAKWTEEPLEGQTAGGVPMTWLLPLLGRAAVTRVGNVYRSGFHAVVVGRVANGYTSFDGTIKTVTRAGTVVAEDIAGSVTDHNELGPGVPSPACGDVTYGAFGTAPPVTAPPAGDVGFG